MRLLPLLYLVLALQGAPSETATVEDVVMKQGTTDPLPQVSVGLVPEGCATDVWATRGTY